MAKFSPLMYCFELRVYLHIFSIILSRDLFFILVYMISCLINHLKCVYFSLIARLIKRGWDKIKCLSLSLSFVSIFDLKMKFFKPSHLCWDKRNKFEKILFLSHSHYFFHSIILLYLCILYKYHIFPYGDVLRRTL